MQVLEEPGFGVGPAEPLTVNLFLNCSTPYLFCIYAQEQAPLVPRTGSRTLILRSRAEAGVYADGLGSISTILDSV